MKHHIVAMPSGFAVAYRRPNGELCSVSEHPDRQSASREVQRLMLVSMLKKQDSDRAGLRQHAYAERRTARWFPDDQYA